MDGEEAIEEEAARMNRQEHPAFLGMLSCGHIERFVLSPILGWSEWCSACVDFCQVVDGV